MMHAVGMLRCRGAGGPHHPGVHVGHVTDEGKKKEKRGEPSPAEGGFCTISTAFFLYSKWGEMTEGIYVAA